MSGFRVIVTAILIILMIWVGYCACSISRLNSQNKILFESAISLQQNMNDLMEKVIVLQKIELSKKILRDD